MNMKDEPPPSSSTVARIISGSVGSMVYVTAFAPLEVVKIRQQAGAHSTSPTAREGVSVATTRSGGHPSSSSSSSSSVKAPLRGRGAVVLSNGLVLPTSAFPCLVTPALASSHHSRLFESTTSTSSSALLRLRPAISTVAAVDVGVFRELRSIARIEGPSGLYAGLRPTLLAVVPNSAIYLTAYDEIASRLRRWGNGWHDDRPATVDVDDGDRGGHWIPFAAGASARLVSSVATAPLELVRTRQAASSPRRRGVLEELRLLLRTSGPSGLYRGLVPMILRDVPFSAVYFTCLEAARSRVSDSIILGRWGARYHRERGDRPPANVEAMEAFVGGMAAGSIATVLTTPFDVVKTRRMTSRGGRHCRSDMTLIGHMSRIVKEKGMRGGLWRGNWARMIKVAPGSAIMISSYELGKRTLEDVM